MKRRNFIINTSKVVAATPFLLNGIDVQAAANSPLFNPTNGDENDNILVIIRLDGGNDGLNSVVPVDQMSHLAKARKNILLPESKLLKLTDTLSLHPVMTGMQEMYKNGYLNIVQGVGYPDQNRSHFRSKDIWTSASDANKYVSSGWVGRWLDHVHPNYPVGYPNTDFPDPVVISLGNRNSVTCQGTNGNYSIAVNNPQRLSTLPEGVVGAVPDNHYGYELDFLRGAIAQTNKYSETLTDIVAKGKNLIDYPDSKLADQLKTIALLISGGCKTKVYIANLRGFDTHAGQVDDGETDNGTHAFLMDDLSSAIHSFHNDLKAQQLSKRVVGFTFSEFGRQIVSNASFGTDHGTAAPMFIFGDCVNPEIIGTNVDVSDAQPKDGVPMQYDFRSVYGSVLMDWFDVDQEVINEVLFKEFQHLPIINGCEIDAISSIDDETALNFTIMPNPIVENAEIRFTLTNSNYVNVKIFDTLGGEHLVLIQKKMKKGDHKIRFGANKLIAGVYYCRLAIGNQQWSRKFVKI